jgi:hypothetical protein
MKPEIRNQKPETRNQKGSRLRWSSRFLVTKEKHENTKDETSKKTGMLPSPFVVSCFRVFVFVFSLLFLVCGFSFLVSTSRGQEQSPNLIQETDELRDITGIEQVPPAPGISLWPYGLALGFLLAGSLFSMGWRYFRREHSQSGPPPDQWALTELDGIDAQNLPQAGQVERYHTLISGVIRNYLESRFHLPASRQTTPEFLQSMRGSSFLPGPQQKALRDFLEQCDLAKFARVSYSLEECRSAGEIARQLVRETPATDNNQPPLGIRKNH